MTNILDSVDIEAYRIEAADGRAFLTNGPVRIANHKSAPLYSRETVESIIEAVKAETRKEVLLEAEKSVRPKPIFCAMTTEILHATSALHKAADELRRMADQE